MLELAPYEFKDLFDDAVTAPRFAFEKDGISVAESRLEVTEKGNVHLYAVIEGKEFKYIFGNGKEVAEILKKEGIGNQSEKQMQELVEAYIFPKLKL